MSKKDNIRGYDDKKIINWLKRIFGNCATNPYKIRNL